MILSTESMFTLFSLGFSKLSFGESSSSSSEGVSSSLPAAPPVLSSFISLTASSLSISERSRSRSAFCSAIISFGAILSPSPSLRLMFSRTLSMGFFSAASFASTSDSSPAGSPSPLAWFTACCALNKAMAASISSGDNSVWPSAPGLFESNLYIITLPPFRICISSSLPSILRRAFWPALASPTSARWLISIFFCTQS